MEKYARVIVAIALVVSMSFMFLPSDYVAARGLVKNQSDTVGMESDWECYSRGCQPNLCR